MIALPAFLQKNGVIFGAGILLGALAAWGPASCSGKSQANQVTALKNIAVAAQNRATAEKMEKAAALTEMALAARTRAEVQDLREIVRDKATGDAVGSGMQHVLERMRQRAAAR